MDDTDVNGYECVEEESRHTVDLKLTPYMTPCYNMIQEGSNDVAMG